MVKDANVRRELLRAVGDFSTIGMSVGLSLFIGVWIGHWLDHSVFDGKTAPWLTLIFLGFGIAAGFKNLYMLVRRRERKEKPK